MNHSDAPLQRKRHPKQREDGFPRTRAEELLQKLEAIVKKLSIVSSPPDTSATLLTRQDLAKRLQCSLRTVDTLVARGDIQVLRIRGCVRFSPNAIDAYIRRVAEASE